MNTKQLSDLESGAYAPCENPQMFSLQAEPRGPAQDADPEAEELQQFHARWWPAIVENDGLTPYQPLRKPR